MRNKLERDILKFLGLAVIWDYLLSAEYETEEWINNFEKPLFDGEALDLSAMAAPTMKAENEALRILKKQYWEIDDAFHNMSADELAEYGISEWNDFLSQILFESLCEGNIPYNFDEQLDYFKDVLADCNHMLASKVL